jgi:serine O-acetyltransferase
MNSEELIHKLQEFNQTLTGQIPSKPKAQEFAEEVLNFLFPIRSRHQGEAGLLDLKLEQLEKALLELILPMTNFSETKSLEIKNNFFATLPFVFDKLLKDAQAFLAFDPAAYSLEEIIIAYPGFYAIAIHRLAHELYLLKIPVLPRIISEHAHSKTGIDIHPGATIGESFFIDHGTGVVIGETTVIGNRVKIYQGVTLGALTVQKEIVKGQRHPTIEDSVVIYSGSTILGGNTKVGHDSIIGGNVWLTESVVPYSVVFHKSEVKIRDKSEMKSVLEFVI